MYNEKQKKTPESRTITAPTRNVRQYWDFPFFGRNHRQPLSPPLAARTGHTRTCTMHFHPAGEITDLHSSEHGEIHVWRFDNVRQSGVLGFMPAEYMALFEFQGEPGSYITFLGPVEERTGYFVAAVSSVRSADGNTFDDLLNMEKIGIIRIHEIFQPFKLAGHDNAYGGDARIDHRQGTTKLDTFVARKRIHNTKLRKITWRIKGERGVLIDEATYRAATSAQRRAYRAGLRWYGANGGELPGTPPGSANEEYQKGKNEYFEYHGGRQGGAE